MLIDRMNNNHISIISFLSVRKTGHKNRFIDFRNMASQEWVRAQVILTA